MFFIALCLVLWALFALNAPFDTYGWLFLVGFGWFAGFLDGRRSQSKTKSDTVPLPQYPEPNESV